MSGIQGKVIAITGASSGIGEAAARELARRGARVVLGARRTDRLERLVADMDFVPREEFEAVKAMAAKARAENEALAARIAALESQSESKSGT